MVVNCTREDREDASWMWPHDGRLSDHSANFDLWWTDVMGWRVAITPGLFFVFRGRFLQGICRGVVPVVVTIFAGGICRVSRVNGMVHCEFPGVVSWFGVRPKRTAFVSNFGGIPLVSRPPVSLARKITIHGPGPAKNVTE